MVYPQIVTGSQVDTDTVEYAKWLDWFDDNEPETFRNIRMQGHSHVNFSCNPSSVDTSHQKDLLSQVRADQFYIFLIWNKKDERTILIYDFGKNILFETKDVEVKIIEDENSFTKWLDNAMAMVKEVSYIPPVQTLYTPTYMRPTAPAQPASNLVVIDGGTAAGKKKDTKKNTRPGAGWGSAADGPWGAGPQDNEDGDEMDDYYESLYGCSTPSSGGSTPAGGWCADDDPFGPFGYTEDWRDFNT